MELNFLQDYIVLVVLGICLCVGYAMKQLDFIKNKYIPAIMLCLGTVVNIIVNIPNMNATVILGGMVSGLASTGLYEAMRNLIDSNGKKDGNANV